MASKPETNPGVEGHMPNLPHGPISGSLHAQNRLPRDAETCGSEEDRQGSRSTKRAPSQDCEPTAGPSALINRDVDPAHQPNSSLLNLHSSERLVPDTSRRYDNEFSTRTPNDQARRSGGDHTAYPSTEAGHTAQELCPTTSAIESALQFLNPPGDEFVRYYSIPVFDYTYDDDIPINFTAVELITFLPRLNSNYEIARRLVNNGMTNPIHLEILQEHRNSSKDGTDRVNSVAIANTYMDAIRPQGWRQKSKEEQSAMWCRKNHQTPSEWESEGYHDRIDMNDFRPDRLRGGDQAKPEPQPVPFMTLLRGVKKLPEGRDAADLTRALEYVAVNPLTDDTPPLPIMFPTHLKTILDKIGRTFLVDGHKDGAVVSRYGAQIKARKNNERVAIRKGLSKLRPTPIPQTVALQAPAEPETQSESQSPLTPSFQENQQQDIPLLPLVDPLYWTQDDMTFTEIDYTQVTASEYEELFNGCVPPDTEASVSMDPMSIDVDTSFIGSGELSNMRDDPLQAPQLATAVGSSAFSSAEADHDIICFDWDQSFLRNGLQDLPIVSNSHKPLLKENIRMHAPSDLLRECEEADNPCDQCDIARAARWARRESTMDWRIEDLQIVLDLIWIEYAANDPANPGGGN